ncbi:MAG: DinB family protein, partial [Bacteroidia bacterium]|nr:DinB family protein [Bacteroidia bacterium]
LNIVSALSLEQLNKVPQGFKNNIAWNVGHLVAAVQGVCYGRSGLPMNVEQSFFDMYKPESKPERDITAEELETIKDLMFSTLDTLEADYEKRIFGGFTPFKTRTGVQLNSIEDAITFLLFHEGIHTGVIMSQRKLV